MSLPVQTHPAALWTFCDMLGYFADDAALSRESRRASSAIAADFILIESTYTNEFPSVLNAQTWMKPWSKALFASLPHRGKVASRQSIRMS